MTKLVFKIDGMCCAEEVAMLKSALRPLLNGQEEGLTFDLIGEKIIVEQNNDLPTESSVIKAVASTGMKATPWSIHLSKQGEKESFWQHHGQTTMTTLSALSFITAFIIQSVEDGVADAFISSESKGHTYPPAAIAFYALSMLTGGWFIFPKAIRATARLRPDMNLLMTMAVIGAAAINQWIEAALVSALFSGSLLLESWNINRARKAIRTLMDLAPSTARVVENMMENPVSNKNYIRRPIAADGDCGYSVFEISRQEALKKLSVSLENIQDILKPAIQECLLMESFYNYLVAQKLISTSTSHQEVIENIENYVDDINLLQEYLFYDIQDKRIDAGWAHPCVLQALAHIQKKEIRIWRLNEQGNLIPHQGEGYDYSHYAPSNAQGRIDLLFVNGNHFERLELSENEHLNDVSSSPTDFSAAQNLIIERAVEDIPIGSILIVRPGEKIPMDSILISGPTEVNQAPITGESMPVRKKVGDELFAGTINGDSAIQCQVTKIYSDSTLARIVKMVEDAQSRRANSEQLVERFATYYTPSMMVLSLFVALLMPLAFSHSWSSAIYQALEILVIACPCALVISTPITIVAGINSAARAGVLIKGGMYLEAAASIKAMALDKTGTLTTGEPTVQKILPFGGDSEEELLKLALALEEHSDHPLARAIHRKAKDKNIVASQQVQNFQIFKGKGAEGYLDGKLYWIGSHRLLQEKVSGIESLEASQKALELENEGYSVVAIGFDQHICGLIGISDAVRAESKDVIQSLKQVGLKKIIMLTGDNQGTADIIAKSIGLDDYRAELLPEDKVSYVKELMSEYHHVAMVGDGINDAPAMAESSLAIAMGAAGSDTAIETADIALMSDDLRKLPWLIQHSRRTLGIIKQNVVISLSIKALFIALALANKTTLWMAVVADMGTSFIVVFNGLRLLNNGPLCGWNNNKKRALSLESTQPLLLEQSSNDRNSIEVTRAGEKGLLLQEQKTASATKKPCCKGGVCSKSKATENPVEIDPLLLMEQGDLHTIKSATLPQASLQMVSLQSNSRNVVSENLGFFQEQKSESGTKKPCCKGGACSKSKTAENAISIAPSVMIEQREVYAISPAVQAETIQIMSLPNDGTRGSVIERGGFFQEQKTESTIKKPCCKGGACAKTKAANDATAQDLKKAYNF